MIVIGIGNEFRHDDAAGLIAARRLRERGVPAEEHGLDFAELMNRWKGVDGVILIDAAVSGAAPGTLHRIDVDDGSLGREMFRNSTHALGLADAVELSRALGALPGRVLIFAIEAADLRVGAGLSAEVERAVGLVVEEIVTDCLANSPGGLL